MKLPAQALDRLSALLTLRISYTNNSKTLAEAQRQEIIADLRWREFERCVAKARREEAALDTCFPE